MRLALALILLSLAACGGDAPSNLPARAEAVVRDSAGIRIVENPDFELPRWTLAAEPVLSIGALDGSEAETLFQVNDVERLSDGSWLVSNGGTEEVRVFDPSGAYIRSIGRRGEGPGEFTSLSRVWVLPGDTIAAWDSRARRMTLFDREGTLIRERAFPEIDDGSVSPAGRLQDGTWLVQRTIGFSTGSPIDGELRRPDELLAVVPPDGSEAIRVVTMPASESWLQRDQNVVMIRSVPYGRNNDAVAGGSRIFTGVTELPEIRVWDKTGTEVGRWRLAIEPRAVTEEEWEAERAHELGLIEEGGGEAEWRRQSMDFFDTAPIPELAPIWSELVGAEDGSLWMYRYRPPSEQGDFARWWVLDAEGTLLRVVETPAGLTLHWIGDDLVAGVERDDFDVEYLRVYEMVPAR